MQRMVELAIHDFVKLQFLEYVDCFFFISSTIIYFIIDLQSMSLKGIKLSLERFFPCSFLAASNKTSKGF